MQISRALLVLIGAWLLAVSSLAPALASARPAQSDGGGNLALTPASSNVAAGAALIIVALLVLLYLYRRRLYILYWIGGWACLAASVATDARASAVADVSAFVYGLSLFFSLVGAVILIFAARAYDAPLRLHRWHLAVALPVALWFLVAPLVFGVAAVFLPGHLLTAAALAIAGRAHLVILRRVQLLGAGVVGTMLLVSAATEAWIVVASVAGVTEAPEALLLELALFLITALGMQLMTFEDMTNELRVANARLETAQTELRQMVVTDALTGCRNRRFFDEIIAHELSLRRRYATPLSLLFIDVDRFKVVNDTQGHAAGDRVLREVATFLLRKVRDADYVFRWGGDEFLLMLSCREDEAQRRGEALQLEFLASPAAAGLPNGVGLSFGCAEVSPGAESVHDALKLADERMYTNKRSVKVTGLKAV